MTPPTSLLLTEQDIDLLDWLIHSCDAANRTAMVHQALLHYGRAVGAPARLLHAAVREREERGTRRRVRSGPSRLQSVASSGDDGSAA